MESDDATQLAGVGIAIAAVGGVLSITIIGAVIGIPMMIVGLGLAVWGSIGYVRGDDPETDESAPV